MSTETKVKEAYAPGARAEEAASRAPWVALAFGLALIAVATAGMSRGREPFASWYYIFVWYGTLVAADGVVALTGGAGRRGRFLLLDRPAHLLSVLGWSAV
ncbi:MAG: hypothetical protein ACRELX_07120, partial [Longimicrobiales bacterium]